MQQEHNTYKRLFLMAIMVIMSVVSIAADVVTIGSTEGSPNTDVTVGISLSNTSLVSAMQLNIPISDNVELIDYTKTARLANHTLTVGVTDNVLSIFIVPTNVDFTAIDGSDGEVANLIFRLGNEPETLSLKTSKLILTNRDGNSISGVTSVGGNITTRSAKAQYSVETIDFGSVPIRSSYTRTMTVKNIGNAPLNISSIISSDAAFSVTPAGEITIAAGASSSISVKYSPTERGALSKRLQFVCNSASTYNYVSLKAAPYAVNELRVQEVSGYADSEVTIPLKVNNMDALTGFQFEFDLPSSLEYVDGSFTLSGRSQGHTCIATCTDGHLKAICYSASNKNFIGEDGVIATFKVRIDGQSNVWLAPKKASLTAEIKGSTANVLSASYGAYVRVSSPKLSANSSLSFGSTPVTDDATASFVLRNNGSAPLVVDRILFDKEGYSINATLPLTITAGKSSTLQVSYSPITEGAHATKMHIYTNDPANRLFDVNLSGIRYAPNTISVEADDATISSDAKLTMGIDNYDAVSGMQFDIEYPNSIYTPSDVIQTTKRTDGWTIMCMPLSDNVVRYFCYSLSDKPIERGSGDVLIIPFKPTENAVKGSYTFKITNIILGSGEMANKYSGVSSVNCIVNVDDILRGDMNADGELDVMDVTTLVRYVLNNESDPVTDKVADVNSDGEVDVMDVTLTIRCILNNGVWSMAKQSRIKPSSM